jgi:hypothetical protein
MDLSGSWKYIEDVAKSRLAHNKTKRHVDDYGEYIEIIGAAGEVVARRFLGLKEKLHEEFDGGVDLVYLGRRIDVKATVLTPKVQHRHLQFPIYKPIKSDIILLTAISMEQKIGTVIGYALKSEVLSAKVNNGRDYPCREIPISELHPAWILIAKKVA